MVDFVGICFFVRFMGSYGSRKLFNFSPAIFGFGGCRGSRSGSCSRIAGPCRTAELGVGRTAWQRMDDGSGDEESVLENVLDLYKLKTTYINVHFYIYI